MYSRVSGVALLIEEYAPEEFRTSAPLYAQTDHLCTTAGGNMGFEIIGSLLALDAAIAHPDMLILALRRLRQRVMAALEG